MPSDLHVEGHERFKTPCLKCRNNTSNSRKRCREDYGHVGCDWSEDPACADQQEREAKGTSKSIPGGGAAERPEDGDAGARRYLCYSCRRCVFYDAGARILLSPKTT